MATKPFTPVPDKAVAVLAPGGAVTEPVVTFRGWLSAPTNGVHHFFTSPWLDEWLAIKTADILFQQQLASGSSSIIWVRRDVRITKCETDKACHYADQEVQMGADPTGASGAAAKYPRYP